MIRAGLILVICLSTAGTLVLLRAHHRPVEASAAVGSVAEVPGNSHATANTQPPLVTPLSKPSANHNWPGISRRSRPWDGGFLAGLAHATTNGPIRFELVGGRLASGRLLDLESRHGEVVYASGILSRPEKGRFFFSEADHVGRGGRI